MKKINIFSFGRNSHLTPSVPNKDVIQIIFDVRPFIDDPYSLFPGIKGTEEKVKNYIYNLFTVKNILLPLLKELINSLINQLETKEQFTELNIYFMCEGGKQRSVAIAEKIFHSITKKNKFLVKKKHLTINL